MKKCLILALCAIGLVACNSGGNANPNLSLSITPQTCSITSNQSLTTNVNGMTTNDSYYYGVSNTESGTYSSFTNPENAEGSNITISDTFTCSQVSSTPGTYYIMVNDTTQGTTSNPVSILITQ